MQIQFIKNQFDSEMRPMDLNESTYKKIIDIVKKPIVIQNKAQIPQWKFCTVSCNKRCNDSMDKTNVLILDFDDSTYTYQEFEHQFQEYQYILHTSYSYDGKNSKFRVLLFLDKEYEIKRLFCKINDTNYDNRSKEINLRSPYHLLLAYFQHVDPASFVKSQFFKVPAIATNNSPYYYNIHKGELFCPGKVIVGYGIAYDKCISIEKEIQRNNYHKAMVLKTQFKGDLTKAVDYVKRKMEEAPIGMRHNCIFGLAAFFSKIGGDYYTFSQIKPSWADKKYETQIKRLQKEWTKIGAN